MEPRRLGQHGATRIAFPAPLDETAIAFTG
jgi:hypothetical protein